VVAPGNRISCICAGICWLAGRRPRWLLVTVLLQSLLVILTAGGSFIRFERERRSVRKSPTCRRHGGRIRSRQSAQATYGRAQMPMWYCGA
jgi:hypothetical protein